MATLIAYDLVNAVLLRDYRSHYNLGRLIMFNTTSDSDLNLICTLCDYIQDGSSVETRQTEVGVVYEATATLRFFENFLSHLETHDVDSQVREKIFRELQGSWLLWNQ